MSSLLRRGTIAALAASVMALSAAPVQARDWETIAKSGTIIVATEGAFPPFNFFQNGKLAGYEIDVAQAVADKLGVKIEWKTLSFDALLAGLRQDRWDAVIASFGYTAERAKVVDFTYPHYCSGGQIVTRTGGPATVKDLPGKTVAVQTGTTYFDFAKKVPGTKEVKNFPLDTDARAALVGGRVDVWITDRFVAKTVVEANAGLVRGEVLFAERVSFNVKRGNLMLKDQLSATVEALQKDGTLTRISEKWFKEDITCK